MNNNRITPEHIKDLMEKVTYSFHIAPETTTTVCTATLWMSPTQSFTLATEYSACVDIDNFEKELGERYAKERAAHSAEDMLWVLEGYHLKKKLTGTE